MEAEVSCRNLRAAVEYVRSGADQEGVEALVRAAQAVEPSITEELLCDDSAWVSARIFRTVLETACRVAHDPDAAHKIGAHYVKSLSIGLMAPVFRAARTPELFFGNLPNNVSRFNRVFSISISAMSDSSVLVRHSYVKDVGIYGDKRACDFTAGAYATVPEFYEGPTATVKEVQCVTRGDPHCEYLVQWQPQKGWFGRMICPRRDNTNLLAETTDALVSAMERLENRGHELEAQRQKEEKIRRRFQQYVPYQVVAQVLGAADTRVPADVIEGDKRTITTMMADIRDFVGLTESFPPEVVVQTLNRFFSMSSRVIQEHRGTIDKFIGDAMLAIFGAPCSFGNDADRAVQAALAIQHEMDAFNEQQRRLGLRELQVGICLATGKAVAGNIGSELRWDYTVIGAPINLASRLQNFAKPLGTAVVADNATCMALRSDLSAEPLQETAIRGLTNPVMVHRIHSVEEQRRFLRYGVDLPAFTANTTGQIQNICLGGVSLVHPQIMDPGQQVRLTFTLLDRELTCEGVVRRVSGHGRDVELGIQIPQSSAAFDADFERFAASHEPEEEPPPPAIAPRNTSQGF